MIRGWQRGSTQSAFGYAEKLANMTAKTIIFTDIRGDGMETDVNWMDAVELSRRIGLSVIASGCVSYSDRVRAVKAAGLVGLISGNALYDQ